MYIPGKENVQADALSRRDQDMPKGADPRVDSCTIQLLKPQYLKGFPPRTIVASPIRTMPQAQDTEPEPQTPDIEPAPQQDVSGQVVFFKNLPVPNYQSLTAEVHPLPPNSVRQLMYRRSTTHKDSASLLSSPN
jgi:hypothetical protein